MAIRSPSTTNLDNRRTNNSNFIAVDDWVRNPAWPAIPTVSSSEQKLVGLYAVFPGDAAGLSNYVAINVQGDYTVDYGDGTITNYNTAVQANYEYDYDNPALDGTNAPVTFQDSGDTVTRNNHGYTDGMTVQFYNIVSTTGINEGQTYYVVNSTTNTFQISNSVGGSPIALTTDGSATLLPYKVAIITITPQAGKNLITIYLHYRHTAITQVTTPITSGWLDINMSAPNCTTLLFSYPGNTYSSPRLLERVQVQSIGNITNFDYMFFLAKNLQKFIWPSNNSSLTSMSNSFNGCSKLKFGPAINTSNVTNMQSLFSSCSRLEAVPLYDTSKVNNMSSMFQTCYNLETTPMFNTASVITMSSMFSNCYNLIKVPLFNTSSVTNMSNMFSSCVNLQTVPLFNTAAVTTMSAMFSGCSALKEVPEFNTANVTSMSSVFQSCTNLRSIPNFNTSKVTNMSSTFAGCYKIKSFPLLDTSNTISMTATFQNCYNLKTVPNFDTSKVTSMNSTFIGCSALEVAPAFNTSNVQDMTGMFSGCPLLVTIPTYVTGNVTNMTSMFNNCYSLNQIPAMNVSSVSSSTNFATIFGQCSSITRIQAKDFKYTFSVSNCNLSANALNEIYTNLPTVTGQTITVTGNPGVATDDPTIATAKGWTVTG